MMIAALGNKVISFGLLTGFIAIRGIFALIAHQSGLSSSFEIDDFTTQKEQKGNPISIIVVLCVFTLFVLLIAWPENRNILIIPLPNWVQWLGIALGTIGLAQQIWVHITLQKNWLAARESGRQNIVIASGPYALIRIPLYLALILVGLFLVSGFPLILMLTLVAIPFFKSVAEKEEAVMVQQFGDEYRNYVKRTGRFFPRLVFRSSREA